ncbi:MAG: DUF1893 domain-containing protein [candidate division KSB1 bacterium]|nr:DUF1893 domain-containing protein [candidate division KSB1 bacterium]
MNDEKQTLKKLKKQGLSIQVEKDEKIIFQSFDGMLKPLYQCLNEHAEDMQGATVIDKVVGRAAAYLCIMGQVEKVITPLASDTAKQVLHENNITLYASEVIPYIINRDKTGMCPMEKLAIESKSPEAFYAKLATIITT